MIGKARQLGFTLIELMVTVAIIAILAAMAYPSFTDMIARNRLKGAAEGLFGDLQFAKSESIKLNQNITLDVTTGTTTWDYKIKDAANTVLKTVDNNEFQDVTFTAGADLTFTPLQGMTSSNADITLTFTRASNTAQTLSVVVSPMGRIKVCTSSSVLGYKSC